MKTLEQQIRESVESEFPKLKPIKPTAILHCVCGRWSAKHGYKTLMRGTLEQVKMYCHERGYNIDLA